MFLTVLTVSRRGQLRKHPRRWFCLERREVEMTAPFQNTKRAESACRSLLGPVESSELGGGGGPGPLVLRSASSRLSAECSGRAHWGEGGSPQGSSLLDTGGHPVLHGHLEPRRCPRVHPPFGRCVSSKPFCLHCDTFNSLCYVSLRNRNRK